MTANSFAYRPDIDGLRALAIICVVLFHASPRMLPGGYIGVDVFFVISGYLITKIIFQGLVNGGFSFAAFYRRRILRIFPALTVVLLTIWVMGWTVLLADEYRQLGKHIAAGAGFVSNFALWQESGYFDKAAEIKPLLHLWSLGIEEQFYLIWPLLLVLIWKFPKQLPWTLAGMVAISFGVNMSLVQGYAAAAFYMPFSRFWELLLGAGLAYAEVFHRDRIQNQAAAAFAWLPGKWTMARFQTWLSFLGLILIFLPRQ